MSLKSALTPLAAALLLASLAGCATPRVVAVRADVGMNVPAPAWTPPPPRPAISVYIEPPSVQPEPVLVDVAPPPMLVEVPPPQPLSEAVWVGGYWGWQGRWVWCAGRWLPPPQPGYHWNQPYYEHRDGAVVFVAGHWAAPGVSFAPPAPGLRLSLQISSGGGDRPVGPPGVFVPPPPGSRPGLVIPAPIGTPPAVVVSAPPVVNVGMRVTNNNTTNNISRTTTTVNNISNVTNITNVTVVAPPAATANGKAFQSSVPAQAHLAAALPALVHAQAPRPASPAPVASFSTGHPPPALPVAQPAAASVRGVADAPAPHAMPAFEPPRTRPPEDRPAEHRPQASEPPHPQQSPHPEPAREAHREEAARSQHHDAPAATATPQARPPAKAAPQPQSRHDDDHGEHKPHRKDEERRESHGEEAR